MIQLESFLLGLIATASVAAGVFFLRFWRDSRDFLFLAFGLAFVIEGLNRCSALFTPHPNEGSPSMYVVRCIAFLIILAGIINKNRRTH